VEARGIKTATALGAAGAPPRPSSARVVPAEIYRNRRAGLRAAGPPQIGRSAPSGGDRFGVRNMLTMARGFERLRNEE